MSDEPYPFESDDHLEIRELDLESVDAFEEARITVGELVSEHASWRYGHVIVDEAQDLTPMEWRMIMRRVRGQSLTIVGDLAQRSASTARSWDDLLPRELHEARRQDLTVNYRSPAEIHALAVRVLQDYAPGVQPSTALRHAGVEPTFEQVSDLDQAVVAHIQELGQQVGGQIAVLCASPESVSVGPRLGGLEDRVRVLSPREAKGLEFDAVVLLEPGQIWRGSQGAADLYISLTRATQRLAIVHSDALPLPLQHRH